MSRKSGAQYKKIKLMKLRSESASLPGQLKISNIFGVKNDATCDENNRKQCVVENGM